MGMFKNLNMLNVMKNSKSPIQYCQGQLHFAKKKEEKIMKILKNPLLMSFHQLQQLMNQGLTDAQVL